MDPIVGVAIPGTVLLGLLGWAWKRILQDRDERRRSAEEEVDDAKKTTADLVEKVRSEIKASGEETRRAVDVVAGKVDALASAIGTHEARLAAGDEKLRALEKKVDGLEQRERERGCFSRCAYRTRDEGGGG